MNNARVEVTNAAGTQTTKDEPLNLTEHWTPGPHPHAAVAITTGRAAAYGEVKASCTVTLTCDQNAQALDATAFLAFKKAIEYTNDAFGLLVANPENPV